MRARDSVFVIRDGFGVVDYEIESVGEIRVRFRFHASRGGERALRYGVVASRERHRDESFRVCTTGEQRDVTGDFDVRGGGDWFRVVFIFERVWFAVVAR